MYLIVALAVLQLTTVGATPNCGDPGNVDNARRKGAVFTFPNKVEYICEQGYKMIGYGVLYCQPSRTWSRRLPYCEKVHCDDPQPPKYGSMQVGEKIAFYSCNPGKQLVGTTINICGDDGQWLFSPPICIEIGCDKPQAPKYGSFQIIDDKIAYYKCDEGKELVGSPASRCLDSGQWTFPAPKCVEITCNKPQAPKYGTLRMLGDKIAYYKCDEGMELLGSPASACLRNGQWIFPPPKCVGPCEIPVIENGIVGRYETGMNRVFIPLEVGERVQLGETVTFRCNENFVLENNFNMTEELMSEMQITCGEDGWSANLTCKADNWECGLRKENISSYINPKIIDGEKVAVPWPWMAALYFIPYNTTDRDKAKIQCGGTVIHRSFILTAAHCLYVNRTNVFLKRNPGEIIVKLGLTKLTDQEYMQEFEVRKFFIHGNYSHGINNFDYDIALLKLKQPIEFNDFIRPICLPPLELPENSTFYQEKRLGLVTGWGHEKIILPFIVRDAKFTDHLKELVIQIQSPSTCKKSLLNRKQWTFTDRMFCAGDGLAGNDSCVGDSGGPFMQWQQNSEGYYYFTQVGIVSWGIGCGFPGTYGFYTHVQNLRGWIDETIENVLKETE